MTKLLPDVYPQPNGSTWAVAKDKRTMLYMNTPTVFFKSSAFNFKTIIQTKLNTALDMLAKVQAVQCMVNAKNEMLQARKRNALIPLTWLNKDFNPSYVVEANAVYNACKLLNIKDFLSVQCCDYSAFVLLTNPRDNTVKILIDIYKNK